jgi:predicted RNase H-like nuclease (RuvC/YqgF family)
MIPDQKRSIVLGLVGLAVVAAAVTTVWAISAKYSMDMKVELEASQDRTSFLENHLRRYAQTYAERTYEKEAEYRKSLTEKDREIRLLRQANSELQASARRLLGLLSSRAGKDEKIAALQESLAKMKEGSIGKPGPDDIDKKDREIEALYKRISDMRKKLEELRPLKAVVIPPLIETLDHHDVEVRTAVINTLKELTGRGFGKDQERWRTWWQRNRLLYMDY